MMYVYGTGRPYMQTLAVWCLQTLKHESDFSLIVRFGQNHIYTVCIRYFWQGNHQIIGHS